MITYPVDIAILASYFALIFALLACILPSLLEAHKSSTRSSSLFLALAAISLLATWTYMFKYFQHSYSEWSAIATVIPETMLDAISHWLHNVSLFDDAWRTVSVGAVQWLWSHQLCAFTVSVWTPFLAIEAQRRNIPFPWAYMLLGQVVAISFAACLFFAVMAALPLRAGGNIQFNAPVTAFCSAIGIATVLISPYVATSSAFMPNLLAMHAVLVVPLVLPERLLRPYTSRQPLALAAMYLFAAGANFANFMQQVIALLATSESKNLIQLMVKVLYSHPAQSSIGWDIICVSLFGATWMIADSRSLDRPKSAAHLGVSQKIAYVLFICTPFLSISTTLPLYLAWREIM